MPVALLMAWTWFRDRLPEPPRVVLITLAPGGLTVIPILIVQTVIAAVLGIPFPPERFRDALFLSFIIAAVVEECFKYLVLARYSARHSAFDEPYDGIVYGVAASLGFACVENLGCVLTESPNGAAAAFGVALMRALLAVPLHGACGALMVICMGIARFKHQQGRAGWTLLGLLAAIGLHGTYNSLLFAPPTIAESEEDPIMLLGMAGAAALVAAARVVVAIGAAWLRGQQAKRA